MCIRDRPAHDAAEIESHLAALRVAGVDVHDMEIRRPDLEDVFLQVMSGTSASNISLDKIASAAAPGRPKQGVAPLGGSEDTPVPSVGAPL